MAKPKIGVWQKGLKPLQYIMHITETLLMKLDITDCERGAYFLGEVSLYESNLCNTIKNRKLDLCSHLNSESMAVMYGNTEDPEVCIEALKEEAMLKLSDLLVSLQMVFTNFQKNC